MIVKIPYKKNEHQEQFHADDLTRFLHLSCGFGGGKTHSLIKKIMKMSFLNRNLDGGLVAPSFPEVRKDVLPELENICADANIEYEHHKQENWIRFPWTSGKIWLTSAETKIRGPNWAFAAVNEVTLISETRYKEVIGRVRVKKAPYPQIVSSGTPEGTGHWLYKKFVEQPMTNSKIIYGDTRNNKDNLDPYYIQSLMDSYDPIMLDAYLRGLFVNMNGNRFYYAYDPEINHENVRYNSEFDILIGMDFNVNPMTCTMWHKFQGSIYGFDEITLMGADTKKLCDAIKARGYLPNNCIIYPDPSGKNRKTTGKSDIQILRDEGFQRIEYKLKAGEHRERQLNMNNLLSKGQIIFNPEKMPKTKQDFSSVIQDQITLGKDKKDPELTHWSDGIDYLCELVFPFSGKKPSIKTTRNSF